MNNPKLIYIVFSALITIAIALGGWSLSAVANIPKEYATKIELKHLEDDTETARKENREDHKEILRLIRDIKESVDKLNK
jgi:hypothetical protein